MFSRLDTIFLYLNTIFEYTLAASDKNPQQPAYGIVLQGLHFICWCVDGIQKSYGLRICHEIDPDIMHLTVRRNIHAMVRTQRNMQNCITAKGNDFTVDDQVYFVFGEAEEVLIQ